MEKIAAPCPLGPEEHTRAEARAALAGLVILGTAAVVVVGLAAVAAVLAWRLTVG